MIEVSLYLLIAIICAIFLFLMAFLGFDFMDVDVDTGFDMDMDMDVDADAGGDAGHFEAGHGDHGPGISPLSLPILLAFGTCFGAAGTAFETYGIAPMRVPFFAGFVSIGVTVAVYYGMVRAFAKAQASTRLHIRSLVGEDGTVMIPIAPDAPGQILVITEERGRTLVTALAEERIPTESVVEIEKFIGSTAIVKRKKGMVD